MNFANFVNFADFANLADLTVLCRARASRLSGVRASRARGGRARGSDQGLTKFFAAYKQISWIGLVPTKFTINKSHYYDDCRGQHQLYFQQSYTLFYKNHVYKNVETQISKKIKNML